jgi:predicted nucleotide-binding protein (sugar kinase/HSP70/actin superfamily)
MIRRKKEKHTVNPLGDPYPVKLHKKERGKKILLVPNVSRAFSLLLGACIANEGHRTEPLPMGGAEAIAMGKKYVHNDMCLPAQIVIGEAILALKSGKYDPNEVVVGTGKVMCDCRLTNYMPLTRKALDDAGFPQVPIVTTDFSDSKNAHPGFCLTPLTYLQFVWAITQADALEYLRRKMRPYELQKGETDRIVENAFVNIAEGLKKGGIFGANKAYKKAIKDLCAVRYDRTNLREPVFIQGE